MDPRESQPTWARQLGLFGVIVTSLLGYTSVGIGLGYWAWIKLGFPFWILILTSSGSLALAMYRIYGMFRKDVNR